jgi:hypothetical protein
MASDYTKALQAMLRCWARQIRQADGDRVTLSALAVEMDTSAADLAKAEDLLIDEPKRKTS